MAAAAGLRKPAPVFLDAPELTHESLPACIRGVRIWADATASPPEQPPPAPGSSPGGSKFQFGKALRATHGAGSDASACSSRGDGKFQDGSNIKRECVGGTLAALDACRMSAICILRLPTARR
eukprot:364974-Chlamydomonas_euryale.AAC.10